MLQNSAALDRNVAVFKIETTQEHLDKLLLLPGISPVSLASENVRFR
jgi:hypothetical protein